MRIELLSTEAIGLPPSGLLGGKQLEVEKRRAVSGTYGGTNRAIHTPFIADELANSATKPPTSHLHMFLMKIARCTSSS
jgi:hypothetical protein